MEEIGIDGLVLSNEGVCNLDDFLKLEIKPEVKVKLINHWANSNIGWIGVVNTLIKEFFSVKETQESDYDIIVSAVSGAKGIGNKEGYEKIDNPSAYKIFFTDEPVTAEIQGYNLSIGFDYFEDESYIRYPGYYSIFNHRISTEYKREGACNPKAEYFACFLVKNGGWGDGAIERNKLFHELSEYKFVASGGPFLNNIGKIIPRTHKDTEEFISKCKFTISYENHLNFPGYMTEKLFQAYFAGSIPIYSGDTKAQEEVNKNAFISRQSFQSNAEMIQHIIELDQNDEEYCKVWNQNIITDSSREYNKQIKNAKEKFKKSFVEPFLKNKLKDDTTCR